MSRSIFRCVICTALLAAGSAFAHAQDSLIDPDNPSSWYGTIAREALSDMYATADRWSAALGEPHGPGYFLPGAQFAPVEVPEFSGDWSVDPGLNLSYDPSTGWYYDPASGSLYNATYGLVLDPQTGWFYDSQTGLLYDPQTYWYLNPQTGEYFYYDAYSGTLAPYTGY